MENKNIFENENVKLRLIDLEYDYKEKFASDIESEKRELKQILKSRCVEYTKKKHIEIFQKIWKYTHLMNLLKKI